jgi:pimeloyl-ACP methyl ester carboxylesterase
LHSRPEPEIVVAKHPKSATVAPTAVRTRRAYFDCRFGQLHVRTAFPTTGGFDEGVTLICIHSRQGSSRSFARLLPEIASERSVYAPDLPGFGESDAAPTVGHADAAHAVSDLAHDLRLRQIDLLGVNFGAAVALELAVSTPELVRRLVLVGAPPLDRIPAVKQACLVVKTKVDRLDEARWAVGTLPQARVVEIDAPDLFESDPKAFAGRIGPFLTG